jgi:hypothetical protein
MLKFGFMANSECVVQGGQPIVALERRNLGRSSRTVALRDAGIIADRARGLTWPTIAMKYKLTVRGCQKIAQSWRDDGLGDDVIDPIAEARALLDLLAQAVEDYAALEERTKHDGVRIAATRRKIDAALTRFELLQALGIVPHPRAIAAEREIQQMFGEFAELARSFDLPDDFLGALLELADRKLVPAPRRLEAA